MLNIIDPIDVDYSTNKDLHIANERHSEEAESWEEYSTNDAARYVAKKLFVIWDKFILRMKNVSFYLFRTYEKMKRVKT